MNISIKKKVTMTINKKNRLGILQDNVQVSHVTLNYNNY